MGTQNLVWSFGKKCFTCGLVALTISDRYASIVPVRGASMSPTFNPHSSTSAGSIGNILTLLTVSYYIVKFITSIMYAWLQMTEFWWRNFAFKSTNFLMVMW